jgi:hypothetical protein
MTEIGWYKKDPSSGQLIGPGQHPGWALLNRNPQDHLLYVPYPVRGWTWQDDGDHGEGYYHTDGTYKSGHISPPDYPRIMLDAEVDDTPCFGWHWLQTRAEAYALFGIVPPPEEWQQNTAYAVGVKVHTDRIYICTQAGTSNEYSYGPQMFMGDTGITDGTCVWDAVI